jgi:hypothetical protein
MDEAISRMQYPSAYRGALVKDVMIYAGCIDPARAFAATRDGVLTGASETMVFFTGDEKVTETLGVQRKWREC